MTVTVKIDDKSRAVDTAITTKANIFLRFVADDIIKNSTPKTPKKTGRLRMDILKQVLGLKGKVLWGKNYAIYQETKQFRHYTTSGTGPHYAENGVKKTVQNTNQIAKSAGLA